MDASAPGGSARFRQGAGRSCLDFIRTLRYRATPDTLEELPDAEALSAWIAQFGPFTAPAQPTPAQVRQARALREAIHDLITTARSSSPQDVTAATRKLVNDAARNDVPAPALSPAGELEWRADDPTGAMLALLARDALDLATSEAISRVRNCAAPNCGALFYDGSRPGRRRWCSMDRCGNQAKKTAFRARHTTERA